MKRISDILFGKTAEKATAAITIAIAVYVIGLVVVILIIR